MARSGAEKGSEWRERLRRFEIAGTSIARFCRDERVSQPSFFAWRKRLTSEARRESEFAAVRIVGGESVRVLLPCGATIEIPGGDEQAIRVVIDALLSAGGERC